MWNSNAAAQYRLNANFSPEYVKNHPEARNSQLILHGTKIAEMNGWRLDENLSKLNSNSGQIRQIFYSANFKHTNCYLSIDLEGPEICYELFNKRGKHQGEIKWDGSPSGKADKTGGHDILIS